MAVNGYSQWLAFAPTSIRQYNSVGTAAIKLVFEDVGDESNTITIPNKTGTLSLLTDIPDLDNYSGYIDVINGTDGSGIRVHDTANTSPYTKYGYDKIETYGNSNALQYTLNIPDKNGTLAITDDIPDISNLVTADTPQTISGAKTFSQRINATLGVQTGNVILSNSNIINMGYTYDYPQKSGTLALTSDIPDIPEPTTSDNGKVIGVQSGAYALVEQSGGESPANMVTTDTAQNITGDKTYASSTTTIFEGKIIIGGDFNYRGYNYTFGGTGGEIALKNDIPDLSAPASVTYEQETGATIAYGMVTPKEFVLPIIAGDNVTIDADETNTHIVISADSSTPSNMVTTNTEQTITGIKNFARFITIGDYTYQEAGISYDGRILIRYMDSNNIIIGYGTPDGNHSICRVNGELTVNGNDVALVEDLPRSITLTPTPSDDGTIYGTVGSSDLSLLQASDNNYVTLNGKLYRLSNKQSATNTLSYTNTDIDSSGNLSIGTIIVTISDGAWQLYESSMASSTEISNIFGKTTTYTETYNVDSVDALPQTASAGALANVSGTYYKYEE